MMHTLGSSLSSMWLVVGLLGLALSGCGQQDPEPNLGGESHFLSSCVEDTDCGPDESCLCGICTMPCTLDGEGCGELAACADTLYGALAAMCVADDVPAAICLGRCVEEWDCVAGFTCHEGLCVDADAIPTRNMCGGTEPLDRDPGTTCGPCNDGTRVCDGLDATRCDGASDAPCPDCFNGLRDGDELGIDCGGPCDTCLPDGTLVVSVTWEPQWVDEEPDVDVELHLLHPNGSWGDARWDVGPEFEETSWDGGSAPSYESEEGEQTASIFYDAPRQHVAYRIAAYLSEHDGAGPVDVTVTVRLGAETVLELERTLDNSDNAEGYDLWEVAQLQLPMRTAQVIDDVRETELP